MFGMHYIYWGKKLMLILCKNSKNPEWDGIWLSTGREHHESLKNDIPELLSFSWDENAQPGNWLMIPPTVENFEGAAIKICELVSHGDKRVGRVTKKPPQ